MLLRSGSLSLGTGESWRGFSSLENSFGSSVQGRGLRPRWAVEKANTETTQARRLESRGSRLGRAGVEFACGRCSLGHPNPGSEIWPPFTATPPVGGRGPSSLLRHHAAPAVPAKLQALLACSEALPLHSWYSSSFYKSAPTLMHLFMNIR